MFPIKKPVCFFLLIFIHLLVLKNINYKYTDNFCTYLILISEGVVCKWNDQ